MQAAVTQTIPLSDYENPRIASSVLLKSSKDAYKGNPAIPDKPVPLSLFLAEAKLLTVSTESGLGREEGVVGVGCELLTCPYLLKVQARQPRDQRSALRSRISEQGRLGLIKRSFLYSPTRSCRLHQSPVYERGIHCPLSLSMLVCNVDRFMIC